MIIKSYLTLTPSTFKPHRNPKQSQCTSRMAEGIVLFDVEQGPGSLG